MNPRTNLFLESICASFQPGPGTRPFTKQPLLEWEPYEISGDTYHDVTKATVLWKGTEQQPIEASFFVAENPYVFAIVDIFVPVKLRGNNYFCTVVSLMEQFAQDHLIPVIEAHESVSDRKHAAWWAQRGYNTKNNGTVGGTIIMEKPLVDVQLETLQNYGRR